MDTQRLGMDTQRLGMDTQRRKYDTQAGTSDTHAAGYDTISPGNPVGRGKTPRREGSGLGLRLGMGMAVIGWNGRQESTGPAPSVSPTFRTLFSHPPSR